MLFEHRVEVLADLAAALLGHGRNGHANDLAVGLRVQTEVGGLQGLLNLFEDGWVPGRDDDQLRFRRGQLRELADGRVRAVVVDLDLVKHVHAGAPGAGGGQAGLEGSHCLVHAPLEVARESFKCRIAIHVRCHRCSLTRPNCQR